MGKLSLILGGARSGKSTYAEKLAGGHGGKVVYIATAQGLDDEMKTRIAAHRAQRPSNWNTLEIPTRVGQSIARKPPEADLVLLDCLTLLVSNILMEVSDDPDSPAVDQGKSSVEEEIQALLSAIESSRADWIIVSNEVGMGLVPPYPLGRLYRDMLGWANRRLAENADEVTLMVAGLPWRLKPA